MPGENKRRVPPPPPSGDVVNERRVPPPPPSDDEKKKVEKSQTQNQKSSIPSLEGLPSGYQNLQNRIAGTGSVATAPLVAAPNQIKKDNIQKELGALTKQGLGFGNQVAQPTASTTGQDVGYGGKVDLTTLVSKKPQAPTFVQGGDEFFKNESAKLQQQMEADLVAAGTNEKFRQQVISQYQPKIDELNKKSTELTASKQASKVLASPPKKGSVDLTQVQQGKVVTAPKKTEEEKFLEQNRTLETDLGFFGGEIGSKFNYIKGLQEAKQKDLETIFVETNLDEWAKTNQVSENQLKYLKSKQEAVKKGERFDMKEVDEFITTSNNYDKELYEAGVSGETMADFSFRKKKESADEIFETLPESMREFNKSLFSLNSKSRDLLSSYDIKVDPKTGQYDLSRLSERDREYLNSELGKVQSERENLLKKTYFTINDDIVKRKSGAKDLEATIKMAEARLKTLTDPNQKMQLQKAIDKARGGLESLNNEISELQRSKTSFFESDPKAVKSEVNSSPSAKSIFNALPENLSGKEKFDFYYRELNNKNKELAKKYGIDESRLDAIGQNVRDWLDIESLGLTLSKEEKEYMANKRILQSLSPLYFNNTVGITEESGGFVESFMSGFANVVNPTTTLRRNQTAMGGEVLQFIADKGLDKALTTDKALKDIEDRVSDIPWYSTETLAGAFGSTAAIIADMTVGGAILAPVKGAKTFRAIASAYDKTMDATTFGKYLKPFVDEGLKYESVGNIIGSSEDELNFASGFIGTIGGELVGKAFKKLGSDKLTKHVVSMFGSNSERAAEVLKRAGEINARGIGEVGEEFTQELVGIYNDELREKGFWEEVESRYGSFNDIMKLVASSYIMGAGFGANTDAVSKKLESQLTDEERATVNQVVQSVRDDVASGVEAMTEVSENITNSESITDAPVSTVTATAETVTEEKPVVEAENVPTEKIGGETQTEVVEEKRPTIIEDKGNVQGTEYTDENGRFYSEKEVLSMTPEQLSTITLRNPSNEVKTFVESIFDTKEEVTPVVEQTTADVMGETTPDVSPVSEAKPFESNAQEKFKRVDVKSSNDATSLAVTQELADLGKEMDDNNLGWKIGNLRDDVSGRLIVDVVLPDGRTFMMYKSTGTGSGAESKGEWVPLSGFAENGWFIKTGFNPETGKSFSGSEASAEKFNPKFNKYGSSKFKEIADYLKENEFLVFSEQAQEQVTPTETQAEVISPTEKVGGETQIESEPSVEQIDTQEQRVEKTAENVQTKEKSSEEETLVAKEDFVPTKKQIDGAKKIGRGLVSRAGKLSLMGNSNRQYRQRIIENLTGVKVPLSKATVQATREVLISAAEIDAENLSDAAIERRIVEWLNSETKQAEKESKITPQQKRKTIKESREEYSTNPIFIAMNYFVQGGKISSEPIQKIFGKKGGGKDISGEVRLRKSSNGIVDEKEGITLDRLYELVEQGLIDAGIERENIDINEIMDVVNSVIMDNNTTTSIVDSLYDYINDIKSIEKEAVENAMGKEISVFDKAISKLEELEKQLEKFGKETLGINIPTVLLKQGVSSVKKSLKAGKTIYEAIEKALSDIKKSEWYKSLSSSDKEKSIVIVKNLIQDGKVNYAPNGEVSNLSDKNWNLVRTKEFKDKFGDWESSSNESGVILDENGEPKVLYHGTKDLELSDFSNKYYGNREHSRPYDDGLWFTDSIDNAKYFSGVKGKILEVFLKFEKPIIIDVKDSESVKKALSETLVNSEYYKYSEAKLNRGEIKEHPDHTLTNIHKNTLKKLENGETDGVIFNNLKDVIESTNYQVYDLNSIFVPEVEDLNKKGLDAVINYIDSLIFKLDKFGKETMGVSIPIPILKAALKAAKKTLEVTGDTYKMIEEAVQYIKDTKWYENLNGTERKSTEQDLRDYFSGDKNLDDLVSSEPIAQQETTQEKSTVGENRRKQSRPASRVINLPKSILEKLKKMTEYDVMNRDKTVNELQSWVKEVGAESAYEYAKSNTDLPIHIRGGIILIAGAEMTKDALSIRNQAEKTNDAELLAIATDMLERASFINAEGSLMSTDAGQLSALTAGIYEVYPLFYNASVLEKEGGFSGPNRKQQQGIAEFQIDLQDGVSETVDSELTDEAVSEVVSSAVKKASNKSDKRAEREAKERAVRKKIEDAKKKFFGGKTSASASVAFLSKEQIEAIGEMIGAYLELGTIKASSVVNRVYRELADFDSRLEKKHIMSIARDLAEFEAKYQAEKNDAELKRIEKLKKKLDDLKSGKETVSDTDRTESDDVRSLKEEIENERVLKPSVIRQLVKDYMRGNTEGFSSLASAIAIKTGLDPYDASILAAEIEAKLKDKVKKMVDKKLEKFIEKNSDKAVTTANLRSKKSRGEATKEELEELARREDAVKAQRESEQIMSILSSGQLSSNQRLAEAFQKRFGYSSLSPETKKRVDAIVTQINELQQQITKSVTTSGGKVVELNTVQRLRIKKLQSQLNTLLDTQKPWNVARVVKHINSAFYVGALSGVMTLARAVQGGYITSLIGAIVYTSTNIVYVSKDANGNRQLKFGGKNLLQAMVEAGKSGSAAWQRAMLARKTGIDTFGDNVMKGDASSDTKDWIERTFLLGLGDALNERKYGKVITGTIGQVLKGVHALGALDSFLNTAFGNYIGVNEQLKAGETIEDVDADLKQLALEEYNTMVENTRREIKSEGFTGDIESEITKRLRKELGIQGSRYSAKKVYTTTRVQELRENQRYDTFMKGVALAKYYSMISEGDGVFGWLSSKGKEKMAIKDTDSAMSAIAKGIMGSLFRFINMTGNSLNMVMTNIPGVGIIPSIIGLSKNPDTNEWSYGFKYKNNPLLTQQRIASNVIMSTITVMVFANMFDWDDDEEKWVLDPDRAFDIRGFGEKGMGGAKKNERKFEDWRNLSISFTKDKDGNFTNYISVKLIPPFAAMIASLSTWSDPMNHYRTWTDDGIGQIRLDDLSRNPFSTSNLLGAIGNNIQIFSEQPFSSVGRLYKNFSAEKNAFDGLVNAMSGFAVDNLKPIINPSSIQSITRTIQKYADSPQKEAPGVKQLVNNLYGLDAFITDNKTDVFGNTYPEQTEYERFLEEFLGAGEKRSEKIRNIGLLYKFGEGANITKKNFTEMKKKSDEGFVVYYTDYFGDSWSEKYLSLDDELAVEAQNIQEKLFNDYINENYEYLNSLPDKETLESELKDYQEFSVKEAKRTIVEKYEKTNKIKKIEKDL